MVINRNYQMQGLRLPNLDFTEQGSRLISGLQKFICKLIAWKFGWVFHFKVTTYSIYFENSNFCKMGPYAGSEASLGSSLCMGHAAKKLQGHRDTPFLSVPSSPGTWVTSVGDWGVLCGEMEGVQLCIGIECTASVRKRKECGGQWSWSWVRGQLSLECYILGKSHWNLEISSLAFQVHTKVYQPERKPEQNLLFKCMLARFFLNKYT